MLTVEILINGKKILNKNVINITKSFGKNYGKGTQIYKVEGTKNTYIKHQFNKGAIKLAIKLLDIYKDRTKSENKAIFEQEINKF